MDARGEAAELDSERLDEVARRLEQERLVLVAVRLEPRAVVVLPQVGEEAERSRREALEAAYSTTVSGNSTPLANRSSL